MTEKEAMDYMCRLKIDATYNRKTNDWCASIYEPKVEIGWGQTPAEAVAQLLERIGAATKVEVANAISG